MLNRGRCRECGAAYPSAVYSDALCHACRKDAATNVSIVCSDCGQDKRPDSWGWHSLITNNLQSRALCDPCYRRRSQLGKVFDPRPIQQLTEA